MIALKLLCIGTTLEFATAATGAVPTDEESDAFVRTYSLDVLKAITAESLALKVEAGELTQARADCASAKIDWDSLLVLDRPIVISSFRSAETVNAATAFYSSEPGVKLSEFGATTLRAYLRSKTHGQSSPPVPSVPPSYTEGDIKAASAFSNSPAGEDFGRFVKEGLPRLSRVDRLQSAIAACASR